MQTHSSRSEIIDGVDTKVAILNYADRVLVLVTQLGKIGHMIQASLPATMSLLAPSSVNDGLPQIEPPPSIELASIFGTAPSTQLGTLHSLYASHIATLVWTMTGQTAESGTRRDVVVGLALKKSQGGGGGDAGLTTGEQTTFKGVMKMIIELLRDGDEQR